MKKIVLILISIILLILDNTLLPFFAIDGAYPSLLFTFAVAYSLISGREEGVFIGVVSGLLQDIFFFGGFGVNALINMLICYIASIIGDGILKEKRIIPVVSVSILYVIKHICIIVILYFVGLRVDLFKGLIIAIYSSVIMLFMYKWVLKLSNIEFMKRPWRFR